MFFFVGELLCHEPNFGWMCGLGLPIAAKVVAGSAGAAFTRTFLRQCVGVCACCSGSEATNGQAHENSVRLASNCVAAALVPALVVRVLVVCMFVVRRKQ